MNLLASALYDPAVAVSKATSALLAMTAFDTANLRLAVTVPAHGKVRFRLRCTLSGATTFPTILLGVLNGATVVGRVAPVQTLGNTAVATAFVTCDAEFTATGLAAGATNFDAAYGVETLIAATNIKYGGPNNATANDAWGGFVFEAWDPQPLPTAAPGAVNGLLTAPTTANVGLADLSRILGTALTETAGQIAAGFKKLFNVAAPTAQADNLPLNTDYTAARAAKIDNLDAAISTRSTYAGGAVASVTGNVGGNVNGNVLGSVGSVTGLTAANLDVAISTRMATYAQPAGFLAATFPAAVGDATQANVNAVGAAVLTRAVPGDAMTLTGGERTTLVGVFNTTAIIESYRANGAAPSPAQFICEMLSHLGESSIAGTVKSVHKLDHVTVAQTYTLDDALAPTSITRTT